MQRITLFVALVLACATLKAQAQTQETTAPLKGGLKYDVIQPPDGLRLHRAKVEEKEGSPEPPGLNLRALTPVNAPLLDAAQFSGQASQAHATLVTGAEAQHKLAPYIWCQGRVGYYDASGTTQDVVNANKLYLYGGKFADGTLVPPTPITRFNSSGHAFKQSELTTDIFWSH